MSLKDFREWWNVEYQRRINALEAPHYVVGLGEVGSAIAEVLGCGGTDIDGRWSPPPKNPILHIAIPWSDDFIVTVMRYEAKYEPQLVVIHSTVPVGTCEPMDWVHSPVRGRHPDLAEGLRSFVKHFGGSRAEEAAEVWPGPISTTDKSANTEAGKLWELIQYGVQIRINQAIFEWCQANGVDPDVAYTEFAETYNDGYSELGDFHFVRPVLKYMPGPIGGHCVAQNSRLLDHWLSDVVLSGQETESAA